MKWHSYHRATFTMLMVGYEVGLHRRFQLCYKRIPWSTSPCNTILPRSSKHLNRSIPRWHYDGVLEDAERETSMNVLTAIFFTKQLLPPHLKYLCQVSLSCSRTGTILIFSPRLDRLDLVDFAPEICVEYLNNHSGQIHQACSPRTIRTLLYTNRLSWIG